MGSVRSWAFVAIIAGVVAAAPVPPVKPADGESPQSAVKLLKHRKVQKELRLSSDQRIAILDGIADIEEMIDKKRLALSKMPNATPDRFEKLEKEHRETTEKFFRSSTAKLLTPTQRLRLEQIDRQIRGPLAFADAGLKKLLRLNDKQLKSVEDAVKAIEEKIDSYAERMGNDDSDSVKEELVKLRQESLKSLTALLSAEQREVWQSLSGEAVKGFDTVEMWFTLIDENEDMSIP